MIWEDEACDTVESVEKTEQGYRLSMEVPSSLFKFILGKRAETKKKIEKETSTQIMIPRQGKEGDVGEFLIPTEISGILSITICMPCMPSMLRNDENGDDDADNIDIDVEKL